MITERMTPKEMLAELLAEIPSISNYTKTLMPKFRRIVIKSNKFPVFSHRLYTSRRKNKYILILRAFSKNDFAEMDQHLFICYYNTNHGYYAVTTTIKGMITYTPHFFSRYAERKGVDLHGVDLIINYFRNNRTCFTATKDVELPDGTKQTIVEGSTEEGVLLGLMQGEYIILAKTFITREMAKGFQVKNFPIYEAWREELGKFIK